MGRMSLRKEASDDFSPVSEATLSALLQAENYWECEFETVVQLMANCPIRCAKEIQTGLNQFRSSDSDFQISAFEFGWMNPWWAAKLDPNKKPIQIFSDALNSRSQDLERLYCPTGAIWIAAGAALKCSKTFYGDGHVFCPMSWTAAVDIDDYDDLMMAKAVFRMLNEASC